MRNFGKHLPHYFTLFGLLVFSIIGFLIFSYDRNFQTAIAIAVSFGYFVWGMVHHTTHRDLNLKIVIEYLSISIIGLVVILSLIYRS